MELNYEHVATRMKSSFGGFKFVSEFTLTHIVHNITNVYKVKAEIIGYQTLDPHYWFVSSECLNITNEETLTDEGISNLFDSLL